MFAFLKIEYFSFIFQLVCRPVVSNTLSCLFAAKRLRDFTIGVGSTFETDWQNKQRTDYVAKVFRKCTHVMAPMGDAETKAFSCTEVLSGRFVAVYMRKNARLTLCEVEVYGPTGSYIGKYKDQTNWAE